MVFDFVVEVVEVLVLDFDVGHVEEFDGDVVVHELGEE